MPLNKPRNFFRMDFLRPLLLAVPVTLVIDLLWLGVIAKDIYAKVIGSFMRAAPVWPSALAVYLLIPLGLVLFVLPKADGDAGKAALWGALFGLVLYGVYDFTNHALVKGWPFKIVVIDLVWGMVLCGLSAFLVQLALTKLGWA